MPTLKSGERFKFKFKLKRGDLVTVDLDGAKGSEVYDHSRGRPCVVVMRGEIHKGGACTIVVPIRDADADRGYPWQVPIPAKTGHLHKDSIADCQQIRCVDREERILDRRGELDRALMDKIDDALKHVLQLR